MSTNTASDNSRSQWSSGDMPDRFIQFLVLLHWLRIEQRIEFKLSVLVFRCLNGLAPSYLSRDFQRVSDLVARQRLRSSSTSTLVVPPTRISTAGDRAFPVAAARTWNSLPTSLTTLSSLASFRRQLKTELFVRSFPDLDSSVYIRPHLTVTLLAPSRRNCVLSLF